MCVEQLTSTSEECMPAPQSAVGGGPAVVETVELGRRMVRELEAFLSQALRDAVERPEKREKHTSVEVEPCC
jgi:hypothetical protein